MNLLEHVKKCFIENVELSVAAADTLPDSIMNASQMIVQALLNGQKILSCGNGNSAGNAEHFTSQMISRFIHERPNLPAISLTTDSLTLTAIANNYSYAQIFSKQIRALGHPGDILLALSTRGHSLSLLQAIETAHERNMPVIALTGAEGGEVAALLYPHDLEIRVPSANVTRILEMHLFIVHCLCDLIDEQLFGQGE